MSFSEWETILVFHGVFNIFLYGGPLPGGKPDGLWMFMGDETTIFMDL